jgi:hypothetical protein
MAGPRDDDGGVPCDAHASDFYAHDHVFTDMVVDNIHDTLPGSAGVGARELHPAVGHQIR